MGTRGIDAFTSAIGQPDRVVGSKQMGQPSGKVTAHHVTVARGQSPACHQAESDAATPEARPARVLLEVEKAEVILPSFADNGLCRFLRMIRKQAVQFLVYLTLKVLGVGRKPDRAVVATCPDSRRGYISKGFADPGPRFGEYDIGFANRLRWCEGRRDRSRVGPLLGARLGAVSQKAFELDLSLVGRDGSMARWRRRCALVPIR